jgi:hypothetical protein
MKTSKITGGYKLEYKGFVRFCHKSCYGWVLYHDADFCYGGGTGTETLKEQKEGMVFLIDSDLDFGKKVY